MMTPFGGLWSSTGGSKRNVRERPCSTEPKNSFLIYRWHRNLSVSFAVLTLLSGALMIGALHLGLSVFEEKFYEKSLQELDFSCRRWTMIFRALTPDPQHRRGFHDSAADERAFQTQTRRQQITIICSRASAAHCWKESIRTGKSAACNIPICMDIADHRARICPTRCGRLTALKCR
ncbi:MAG: hypothetical protein ACLU9R_04110 [Faecalibacterium sp.]